MKSIRTVKALIDLTKRLSIVKLRHNSIEIKMSLPTTKPIMKPNVHRPNFSPLNFQFHLFLDYLHEAFLLCFVINATVEVYLSYVNLKSSSQAKY